VNRLHLVLLILPLCFFVIPDSNQAIAVGITIILVVNILLNSHKAFLFREWALFLYAMNYLAAPAITYNLSAEEVEYGMMIPSDEYFLLAIPGFLCLTIGIYAFSTRIFNLEFKGIQKATAINEKLLKNTVIVAFFCGLIANLVPSELAFLLYLISLLRFVAAFALLTIDPKNWIWACFLLLFELVKSFLQGMFHDSLMWIVFFALFFVYFYKPNLRLRIVGVVSLIVIILFVQAIKSQYRSLVWQEGKEASLNVVFDVGADKANKETLVGEDNLLATLNRGNQAWIFASTVNHMNRFQDFQGMTIVNQYFEAALLPRFLAPNKIKSGDKVIFNRFSGHYINERTSMGLGIFADGYIAYGQWGVFIFCLALGFIFSLIFKIVENWSKISPFYALLILPLLNYAVGPDCELQTTINHLFKGVLVYGFLVYLTRKRFSLSSQSSRRNLSNFISAR
jgi:hypothetical protein